MSFEEELEKLRLSEPDVLREAAYLFIKNIREDIQDYPAIYGLALPRERSNCNVGLLMEYLKEELNKYYKEWLTSVTCKYGQYHWEFTVEIHQGVQEI